MRLDVYLAESRNISRSKAKMLIEMGAVRINGSAVTKPSFDTDSIPGIDTMTVEDAIPYVSRGGLKLEHALSVFSVDARDRICLDLGASTGGFTDCLLKHGASRVYAIESGEEQLHESLREDPRVISVERCNARYIGRETVPEECGIAVADLSFISQTLIHGVVRSLLGDGGIFISLIKPQFEAGRQALNKNGIVKDPKDRYRAVMKVADSLCDNGFGITGFDTSPIKGGDGNTEYLICSEANASGGLGISYDEFRKRF